MIESMQKEIENRFLRGIAASPGIVIGNSFVKGYAVFKEPTGGGEHEAFVSAQSRNLASLSREIAEMILILSK